MRITGSAASGDWEDYSVADERTHVPTSFLKQLKKNEFLPPGCIRTPDASILDNQELTIL
jgi:hypothetical protein